MSLSWPVPSEIEVLTVAPAFDEDSGHYSSNVVLYEALYARMREAVEGMLTDAQQALSGPGREVTTTLLFGRPASAIVDEACRTRADLVVVGSRGHGPIASAFLGSVSAEVVDHAPCSVLVARRGHLQRAVLATDGSAGAREAEEIIARWAFLAARPVLVVSVGDVARLLTALNPSIAGVPIRSISRVLVDDLRTMHERIAQETAQRLRARGIDAESLVCLGSPATELIEATTAAGADVIVTGTRGRTGLSRLVLGSVARSVLWNAPMSVLTVRPTSPGRTSGSS